MLDGIYDLDESTDWLQMADEDSILRLVNQFYEQCCKVDNFSSFLIHLKNKFQFVNK